MNSSQDLNDGPFSEPPAEPVRQRRIRSFTLRQGRVTEAQRKALETLWPIYGLAEDQPLEAGKVFGREAPLIVEIGFGNGETLAQMAANAPENDFLGIEVHRPGVGHLLLKLKERGLTNVRACCGDAVEILKHAIPDGSLSGVNVFFPDPWHKKRHRKRRLINPEFAELVADKLKPGGIFHAATDWEDYARQMLAVLENCKELGNAAGPGAFSERPDYRPLTKFELRGQRLGHGVRDLMFTKFGSPEPARQER
jgi:tRNA (guanine-N7-)-methyltransferase